MAIKLPAAVTGRTPEDDLIDRIDQALKEVEPSSRTFNDLVDRREKLVLQKCNQQKVKRKWLPDSNTIFTGLVTVGTTLFIVCQEETRLVASKAWSYIPKPWQNMDGQRTDSSLQESRPRRG